MSADRQSDYVEHPRIRGDFVIRDVTVVDPATGGASAHRDVRVAGGHVAEITTAGETSTGRGTSPAASESTTSAGDDAGPDIDGSGRFLVPGFVDAHVHVLNDFESAPASYALMLAHGIVGYRQMSGSPRLLSDRDASRLPQPIGAPALLATCGSLLTPLNSGSETDAVDEVRRQSEAGADFIKSGMPSRSGLLAALDEAARLGIPVDGHLPADVTPFEAIERGMRCIEHLGPGPGLFTASSCCGDDQQPTGSQTDTAPSGQSRQSGPRIPSFVGKLPGVSALMDRLLQRLVVNPAMLTKPEAAEVLEQADETFDPAAADALVAAFLRAGTWQCPTLIRLSTQQFPGRHASDPRKKYIAPDARRLWVKATERFERLPTSTREALHAHWSAQLRMTKLLSDSGVPLLAGTDANGAGWVIPGFALHDEFDLLAEAGLSSLEILRSATSAPARFFGDEVSQASVGEPADFVLLGADPLSDASALHDIDAVSRAGDLFDRAELDAILDRVAAQPTAR